MLKQVFIVVRHKGRHNDGGFEVTTLIGDNIRIPFYEVMGSGDSLEEAESVLNTILSLNNQPIIESMPNGAKYRMGSADEYMIMPLYIKSEVDVHNLCANLMN